MHALTMKRESRFGTNKTIRFCQKLRQTLWHIRSTEQLSIDKRNRWQLISLLKKQAQSSDDRKKILVRRNYNFYQYNGYKDELRAHPPKHLSFPRKPNFLYQPYVNYVRVNQDVFSVAFENKWHSSTDQTELQNMLDISADTRSVTLIYFLDGPKHFYSSAWSLAEKHAFGGSFADYRTVCLGDYCPFGPEIRGQEALDPRISHVVFILERSNEGRKCLHCSCGRWICSSTDRPEYKSERSALKTQQRSKHTLTKQIRTFSDYY